MIWQLVAAGALMLFGAALHGILGDQVLRKVGQLELPANAFGSPANTRVTLRLTWHFGTIAFGIAGVWLLAGGIQPHADFALGVTYFCGTLLSTYGLVGGVVRVYRRGLAGLFRHPVIILIVAAGLVWWGSTSV